LPFLNVERIINMLLTNGGTISIPYEIRLYLEALPDEIRKSITYFNNERAIYLSLLKSFLNKEEISQKRNDNNEQIVNLQKNIQQCDAAIRDASKEIKEKENLKLAETRNRKRFRQLQSEIADLLREQTLSQNRIDFLQEKIGQLTEENKTYNSLHDKSSSIVRRYVEQLEQHKQEKGKHDEIFIGFGADSDKQEEDIREFVMNNEDSAGDYQDKRKASILAHQTVIMFGYEKELLLESSHLSSLFLQGLKDGTINLDDTKKELAKEKALENHLSEMCMPLQFLPILLGTTNRSIDRNGIKHNAYFNFMNYSYEEFVRPAATTGLTEAEYKEKRELISDMLEELYNDHKGKTNYPSGMVASCLNSCINTVNSFEIRSENKISFENGQTQLKK